MAALHASRAGPLQQWPHSRHYDALPSIAATVTSKLCGELAYFQEALSAILTVPPSTSPTRTLTPNGERLLERVLLVDDVLRGLLAGRQSRAAVADKFAGRMLVLERLLSFVSGMRGAWRVCACACACVRVCVRAHVGA